ncbi:MAG: hypothetical protein VXW48_13820 [Pseudomonadota bacterium]|nr:hypothetical protein [Pseudomonadota bacterium]|tara:strand:- start:192 stop:374 length:183 start_codon:yes stop_codon:yes gene_type:complete
MKKLLKAAVAVSVALACTPAFADKNDKNQKYSLTNISLTVFISPVTTAKCRMTAAKRGRP